MHMLTPIFTTAVLLQVAFPRGFPEPDFVEPEFVQPEFTERGTAEIARHYDLRALDAIAPEVTEGDAPPLTLLPLMRGTPTPNTGDKGIAEFDENWGEATSATLLHLFTEHNPDGIAYLEMIEKGVVLLVADEATHSAFAALTELALDLALDRPQVTVRMYEGDTIVGEHAVTIPSHMPVHILDIQTDPILIGLPTEVAQRSGMPIPDIVKAQCGLEFSLQGDWFGEGLHLTYRLVNTDRVEARSARPMTALVTILPENGRIDRDESNAWEESYALEGGALAGETLLEAGRPLLLECSGRRRLEVSLDSNRRLRETRAVALEHGMVTALHQGALMHNRLSLSGAFEKLHLGVDQPAYEVFDSSNVVFDSSGFDLAASVRSLTATQFDILTELVEDVAFWQFGFGNFIVTQKGDTTDLTKEMTVFASSPPVRLAVELFGRNATDGRRDKLGTAEFLAGTQGALVLGREELVAFGASVEVAQGVSVVIPDVEVHFSGTVVALEFETLNDNSLAYRALGRVSYDEVTDSAPMPNERVGERALITARSAKIDVHGVATESDGKYSIRLGGDQGAPGLSLIVQRID